MPSYFRLLKLTHKKVAFMLGEERLDPGSSTTHRRKVCYYYALASFTVNQKLKAGAIVLKIDLEH